MNSTDFVSTGRTAIALANGDFSASLESKQDARMAKKRQKGSKRAVLVKLLLKQKSLKTICKSASRDWQILLTNTKQCLSLAGNCSAPPILKALLTRVSLTSPSSSTRATASSTAPDPDHRQIKVGYQSFKMTYFRHIRIFFSFLEITAAASSMFLFEI